MNIGKIQTLKNEALSNLLEAKNSKELERLRIYYLGRRGIINQLLKKLPSLSPEEKKKMGVLLNNLKKAIEEGYQKAKDRLQIIQKSFTREWLDVTAPGEQPPLGHLHPLTQAIEEISEIFKKLGFIRVTYPEVEWDWYAFEGLNMPQNHPARDEWETFFIKDLQHPRYGQGILTPHTSSGQLREMERLGKPPIRMLNIAKCYRRQADASHAPMFYQFETLVIEDNINVTHLKGTLDYFVRQYFGPKCQTRIRPFHFRFTKLSFEIDVSCSVCNGRGHLANNQPCRVCKQGWLEIGGAGIVHPQVLKNGGIDSRKYSGFASGFGLERVLMIKYGIDNIRLLFDNDLRFFDQF